MHVTVVKRGYCAECREPWNAHREGCTVGRALNPPKPKVRIYPQQTVNGLRMVVEFPDGSTEQAKCFKGAIELFDLWRRVRALGQ